MIVSHKNKYVFIQLPRTGCTAIARELVEKYDGKPFLNKHSTYSELKRKYPEITKNYFIFSGIRNPLDRTVSFYSKLKNGYFDSKLESKLFIDRYYFKPRICHVKNGGSFSAFLKRFYWFPYSDWAVLDHHKFDIIIGFETLNDDFKSALKMIGLTPIRDVPIYNKTVGKDKRFIEYYAMNIMKRSIYVFGPYMKRFNYEFPDSFGKVKIPYCAFVAYYIVNSVRKVFWRYFKR